MNHCECLKLKKDLKDLKKEVNEIRGIALKNSLESKSIYFIVKHMVNVIDYLQEQINDLKHGK